MFVCLFDYMFVSLIRFLCSIYYILEEVAHINLWRNLSFLLSVRTSSSLLNHSYDATDKNNRIMERMKSRNPSTISRRLEVAFGPDVGPDVGPDDVGLLKRLSKRIWRETNQRDPPPLPPAAGHAAVGSSSRGTKRKEVPSSSPGDASDDGKSMVAADRSHVRRRQLRKTDNLA